MNDKDQPKTYADEVIAVLNEKIAVLEQSNAHLREELRLLKGIDARVISPYHK